MWLIFLSLLLLSSQSLAQNSYCEGSNLCVYSQPDGNGNAVFTVFSSSQGWFSFGIGQAMNGATFYTGQANGNGDAQLSVQRGNGHRTPAQIPNAQSRQVPLAIQRPPWATIAFSFMRPLQTAGGERPITPNTQFMWATSSGRWPSMHQSYKGFSKDFTSQNVLKGMAVSSVQTDGAVTQKSVNMQASAYGQIDQLSQMISSGAITPGSGAIIVPPGTDINKLLAQINSQYQPNIAGGLQQRAVPSDLIDEMRNAAELGKPMSSISHNTISHNVTPPTGDKYTFNLKAMLAHGVIMLIAWTFFPLVGAIVARHLKKQLGSWTSNIHMMIMVVGTNILGLFGILYLHFTKQTAEFSDSPHAITGIVVTVAGVFQVMLGFVSQILGSGVAVKETPWYIQMHKISGLLIFVVATTNMILGFIRMQDYIAVPTAFPTSFSAMLVVGIGLFTYLEVDSRPASKNKVISVSYVDYVTRNNGLYDKSSPAVIDFPEIDKPTRTFWKPES